MELKIGRVVRSSAGRDKDKYLATYKNQLFTVNYKILVCEGKERPLERPKSKNPKHIELTDRILDEAEMSTNRRLKKALSQNYEKL